MTKTGKDILTATLVAQCAFCAWATSHLGYWDRLLIVVTLGALGWAVAREVSARQRGAAQ